MKDRLTKRRDDFMSHAHAFAQFKNTKEALPRVRFWVQRAMKEAPISQRQIDNLISKLGHENATWVIQKEAV